MSINFFLIADKALLTCLRPLLAISAFLARNKSGHGAPKEIENVIFIKFLGGGSLLMFADEAQSLDLSRKNTILICSKVVGDFIDTTTFIDEKIILEPKKLFRFASQILSVIWRLRKTRRSNLFINTEFRSFFCALTGCLLSDRQIGLFNEKMPWGKAIYTWSAFFNEMKPIRQTYRSMCRIASEHIQLEERTDEAPRAVVSANSVNKANQVQARQKIALEAKEKFILISAYSSPLHEERNLPLQTQFNILTHYHTTFEARTIVAVGLSNQIDEIDNLRTSIETSLPGTRLINSAGQLTIQHIANLISQADAVFCVDSGILHLARLFDRPVYSFWGPSNPRYVLNQFRKNDTIHYLAMQCSPCARHQKKPVCAGDNVCLRNIMNDESPSAPFFDTSDGNIHFM